VFLQKAPVLYRTGFTKKRLDLANENRGVAKGYFGFIQEDLGLAKEHVGFTYEGICITRESLGLSKERLEFYQRELMLR